MTPLRRLAMGGHPDFELEAGDTVIFSARAIPVHGEMEHMETNADIARACGVRRTLVGRDGDLFMIRSVPGIRRQVVETGRLGWQKQELVRVY